MFQAIKVINRTQISQISNLPRSVCEDKIQQGRLDKQEYGPDHLVCVCVYVMCVCVCVYPATPQNQLCHLSPNVAIYEMSSPSYVTSDASHTARLLLALKTLRRIS